MEFTIEGYITPEHNAEFYKFANGGDFTKIKRVYISPISTEYNKLRNIKKQFNMKINIELFWAETNDISSVFSQLMMESVPRIKWFEYLLKFRIKVMRRMSKEGEPFFCYHLATATKS